MRTATIIFTPDNSGSKVDIQTGEVTTIEMTEMFKSMYRAFGQLLWNEMKQELIESGNLNPSDDEIEIHVDEAIILHRKLRGE